MSSLTIYKASAGSGKTFTLAAEYIAQMLCESNPDAYFHLLAVTFTNKATGEMKERILQYLYTIKELKDGEKNDFLDKVKEIIVEKQRNGQPCVLPSDKELRKRAGDALAHIVHGYDRFRVETIDSFFQSLLSNLAHELGLHANFVLDLEDSEVIRKAVERIITKLGEEGSRPTGMSTQEQKHNEMVRQWVFDFMEQRFDEDKGWDISGELQSFGKEILKDGYLNHEETLDKILSSEENVKAYCDEIHKIEACAKVAVQTLVDKFHENVCDLTGAPYSDLSGDPYAVFNRGKGTLWSFISKLKNGNHLEWPSDAMQNWSINEEKWKKKGQSTLVEDAIPLLMNGLCEIFEKQKEILSCSLCLKNIKPLCLLGEIKREIDAINREQNHFMLAKTPLLFKRLVKESDAPFVMERAGSIFHHVMIDEFQDTSPVQWCNFEKLILNSLASGNDCLLVGDIKQAIYRWRGGDWNLLREIAETAGFLPLSVNYRSAEQVIDFNNKFFYLIRKQLGAAENIYEDVRQEFNEQKGGFVRYVLEKSGRGNKKTEGENAENTNVETTPCVEEDFAQQVLDLQNNHGISQQQMAVLVRSKKDITQLLKYISENHPEIRLVSDEVFLLGSSPAIQRLMAGIRYLRDRKTSVEAKDKISFEYLQSQGIPEELVQNCDELNKLSLYELCERMIGLLQIDKDENASPYLFCFLDHVIKYLDESNTSNLYAFVKFWEENLSNVSIPSGVVDGIRILTIHKSKGLAFHTVFIPYCSWPLEADHSGSFLWCEPKAEPFSKIPSLPINQTGKMKDSIFAKDYEEEHNAQRIENLNLLYVAFTRAEQNLFVWGKAAMDQSKLGNMADLLYYYYVNREGSKASGNNDARVVEEFGEIGDAVQEQKKENTNTNPLKLSNPEKMEICVNASEASHVKFHISGDAQRFMEIQGESSEEAREEKEQRLAYTEKGTILHNILSQVSTPDDIPQIFISTLNDGLITEEQCAEWQQFLVERVNSPKVSDWFDARWTVLNERAIVCEPTAADSEIAHKQGFATPRPDRVITDGKRTIVVDYKFAAQRPEHVTQVQRYCSLLRDMGLPQVEGRLWYVYKNEVVNV